MLVPLEVIVPLAFRSFPPLHNTNMQRDRLDFSKILFSVSIVRFLDRRGRFLGLRAYAVGGRAVLDH